MKNKLSMIRWRVIIILFMFILLDSLPVATSARVFVDLNNSSGPWNGSSWTTAFKTIKEGIDAAYKVGEREIWVAKGTYKPTITTDRTAFFQLRPGVAVYGGFKGTETVRKQRDWVKNVTTLSGEIGRFGDNSDNSYHVVVGADSAVLDGFTITGGNSLAGPAAGPPREPGARPSPGMRSLPQMGSSSRKSSMEESLPPIHITPEIILRGPSPVNGAGMLNYQCAPTVRNCIFKENNAGKGGGVYNMCTRSWPPTDEESSYPTFINCSFISNHARGRGGGVSNDLHTHPTFINCSFINNSCDKKGGGIYNDFGCSPTLTNCIFAGNSAIRGGAIGNDGGSCPTITNCTFTKNYASDMGAALYQGTGDANNPIVTNCILWGDICPSGPKEIYAWHECNPIVTYSCVEGGYRGFGNINADPLFVDAKKGDYRLGLSSPCIDVGNGLVASETDRDENPRYDDKGMPNSLAAIARYRRPPRGSILTPSHAPRELPSVVGPPVDMGAYERQMDTKVSSQDVVYVDINNVKGPWNGKSWATAYRNIQEGLDYAYAPGAEVWVAKGTYKPTSFTNRTVSFQLRPGVAVYGGFKGTETARKQRDWVKNVTALSGDIGRFSDNSDNSYHVVVGADSAVLDGFTITGGNANGETYYGKGGGMVNYNSLLQQGPLGTPQGFSPIVRNCSFTKNYAREGGAMYNYDRCSPILTNCTFSENSADNGGAIVDRVGTKTILTNCTFTRNYANWRGGAIFIDYGSRPKITSCTFLENYTDGNGGGIYTLSRSSQLENTIPAITNCTFTSNRAKLRGGGISNFDHCLIKVTNCIFARNYAGKGGGGISNDYCTYATLTNCTFSENAAGKGKADIDTDNTSVVKLQ